MDRLDAMRVLVRVAEAGSLSAAARSLGMPLATVSRKVSELEVGLKARLMIRSSRKLTLTEAGAAYVATCRRILEDVDNAERVAAGEYAVPRGELVITAPIVFGRMHVLPTVCDFLKAYPDINARIVLGDRWINLQEEHVDLAIRIGHLPDSGLVATKVGDTRRVTCASPAYLDRHGTPTLPDDLASHACITFEGLMPSTRWTFPSGKENISVPIQSRLSVTTAEAAIDAAVAGLGITRVIAYQAASQLRAETLKVVLGKFEEKLIPIHIVYAGQGRLPLKVRAFIDFAIPLLRASLHGSK